MRRDLKWAGCLVLALGVLAVGVLLLAGPMVAARQMSYLPDVAIEIDRESGILAPGHQPGEATGQILEHRHGQVQPGNEQGLQQRVACLQPGGQPVGVGAGLCQGSSMGGQDGGVNLWAASAQRPGQLDLIAG